MADESGQIENFAELKKSIASIVDLTTRVDERVQGVLNRQSSLDVKIDRQYEIINELSARVKVLESQLVFTADDKRLAGQTREELHDIEKRLDMLEQSSNSQEQRWKTIFSFGVQLIWVIVAAYLLYKLGIQSPAVP